jgi:hypothetical protein
MFKRTTWLWFLPALLPVMGVAVWLLAHPAADAAQASQANTALAASCCPANGCPDDRCCPDCPHCPDCCPSGAKTKLATARVEAPAHCSPDSPPCPFAAAGRKVVSKADCPPCPFCP